MVAGHSFGGHIAAEAARQLAASGVDVRAVLMLDSIVRAVGGGSVADYASGAQQAPRLAQRLATHLRVATVGLRQFDHDTHRDAMWEHAIRVQNRHRVLDVLPSRTTVLVTDQNAAPEALWAHRVPSCGRLLRVPGDHNSVLNDESTLRLIADLAESAAGDRQLEGEQL